MAKTAFHHRRSAEAETVCLLGSKAPVGLRRSSAQIGIDIETQIEDGELFDFDVECEPVLEAGPFLGGVD